MANQSETRTVIVAVDPNFSEEFMSICPVCVKVLSIESSGTQVCVCAVCMCAVCVCVCGFVCLCVRVSCYLTPHPGLSWIITELLAASLLLLKVRTHETRRRDLRGLSRDLIDLS